MFGFDISNFESLLLGLIRTGTAMMLMPVFGYSTIPAHIKISLALIIALVVTPIASQHVSPLPPGVLPVAAAAISEVMVGLLFGLVTILMLAGASLAGTVIGTQMGFGIANTIDPTMGGQASLVGQIQYMVALIVMILLDVHHRLIEALVHSFRIIPLGGAVFPPEMALGYGRLSAEVLVIGVKIAAPVMAMLLMTQVALGFVSRVMPRMNVFIVGFPLKIGVGLLGLAISWPLFIYVISKSFNYFIDGLITMVSMAAGVQP